MKKRLLSLTITMSLILGLMNVSVYAGVEEDFTALRTYLEESIESLDVLISHPATFDTGYDSQLEKVDVEVTSAAALYVDMTTGPEIGIDTNDVIDSLRIEEAKLAVEFRRELQEQLDELNSVFVSDDPLTVKLGDYYISVQDSEIIENATLALESPNNDFGLIEDLLDTYRYLMDVELLVGELSQFHEAAKMKVKMDELIIKIYDSFDLMSVDLVDALEVFRLADVAMLDVYNTSTDEVEMLEAYVNYLNEATILYSKVHTILFLFSLNLPEVSDFVISDDSFSVPFGMSYITTVEEEAINTMNNPEVMSILIYENVDKVLDAYQTLDGALNQKGTGVYQPIVETEDFTLDGNIILSGTKVMNETVTSDQLLGAFKNQYGETAEVSISEDFEVWTTITGTETIEFDYAKITFTGAGIEDENIVLVQKYVELSTSALEEAVTELGNIITSVKARPISDGVGVPYGSPYLTINSTDGMVQAIETALEALEDADTGRINQEYIDSKTEEVIAAFNKVVYKYGTEQWVSLKDDGFSITGENYLFEIESNEMKITEDMTFNELAEMLDIKSTDTSVIKFKDMGDAPLIGTDTILNRAYIYIEDETTAVKIIINRYFFNDFANVGMIDATKVAIKDLYIHPVGEEVFTPTVEEYLMNIEIPEVSTYTITDIDGVVLSGEDMVTEGTKLTVTSETGLQTIIYELGLTEEKGAVKTTSSSGSSTGGSSSTSTPTVSVPVVEPVVVAVVEPVIEPVVETVVVITPVENEENVIVTVGKVKYEVPKEFVEETAILKEAGFVAEDVKLVVTELRVAEPDAELVANIETEVGSENLVILPVSFEIVSTITMNDGSIETKVTKNFDKFVTREFELPETFTDADSIMGVRFNEDGTYVSVPTTVYNVDGVWFASISSLSNSVYSLVYSDVKVKSVEGHWVESVVNKLASINVIDDISTFDANELMTRGEFTKYLIKALGLMPETLTASGFGDVAGVNETTTAISVSATWGFVGGYPDGTFKSESTISRQEMSAIIFRANKVLNLKEEVVSESDVPDLDEVSNWARPSMIFAIGAKVYQGYGDGTVKPLNNISKAEAVQVIYNTLIAAELIN